MSHQQPPPVLATATVLELARLAGYATLDEETASRIAVGATQAMRSVAASVSDSLFATEPGTFQPALERLAEAE